MLCNAFTARISDNAFPSAPTVRVLRALESSTFLSLSREEGNETVNHYQPASEGQDSGTIHCNIVYMWLFCFLLCRFLTAMWEGRFRRGDHKEVSNQTAIPCTLCKHNNACLLDEFVLPLFYFAKEKKPKDISQRIFALVLKLSTNGPYYSSPG